GVQSSIHPKPETRNPKPDLPDLEDGGAVEFGGMPGRPVLPPASGSRSPRGDADFRRHGLRIDPGSLRSFAKYIALLPGKKLEDFATIVSLAIANDGDRAGNWDRFASITSIGKRQVFDLTEPTT